MKASLDCSVRGFFSLKNRLLFLLFTFFGQVLSAQTPVATEQVGFNFWTTLLGMVAFLGLAIGALLWMGRSRFSAGEKWLALVMFSFGFILWCYVGVWTNYASIYPFLNHTWPFFTYLIGPALLFYLKDTFQEDYGKKAIMTHFFWPTIAGLFTIPIYLTNFGIKLWASIDLFRIAAAPVIMTSHLLFYSMLIGRMTRNDWQVDGNIKLWTRTISIGLWAYTGAFISYFVLEKCSFFNPEWDYAISAIMALGILMVAYMGLLQRRIFRSEPIANFLPIQKYRTSNLTESASASIKRNMERLLSEDKVFKENELRLDDLAAYLNTNRHQLSQVINEHYGVNFFEMINKYRVEYVKKLLADPSVEHLTIIQIAYEAGFNNKASFNRYFKKEIGMTPSAYRLMVLSGGVGY